MRLERGDLGLIDRGAKLSGLSRTEFMRCAALNEAQCAILNETVVRLCTDVWRQFPCSNRSLAGRRATQTCSEAEATTSVAGIEVGSTPGMIGSPDPLAAEHGCSNFDAATPHRMTG
jgi:hypothetical protein